MGKTQLTFSVNVEKIRLIFVLVSCGCIYTSFRYFPDHLTAEVLCSFLLHVLYLDFSGLHFTLSSFSLQVLSFPEFSSSSVFQMPSSSLRDPSAPPLLLTSPTPEYPPEDASPSAHTSASLIKAIREELRRLAQKQAAVTSYP